MANGLRVNFTRSLLCTVLRLAYKRNHKLKATNLQPKATPSRMSSDNVLLFRSPSTGRRFPQRCSHPSSSSLRRRNTSSSKLSELPEPIESILHKYSLEPLGCDAECLSGDVFRGLVSDGCLHVSDVALLSPESLHGSNKVYQEDSKVVVSVTVEGSSGPIRTMVKLGSSVEEAIKLVINEYTKQGRSPPLDKDAGSQYELHLSSFELESLDRSMVIGNVGSRTFYLRKRSGIQESRAFTSEINCADKDIIAPLQSCPLMVFLDTYVSRKICKILRRMCALLKIIGCLQYDS